MSYKYVILIGLVFQAFAAIPPVWILWAPEQAKFSAETGLVTQITDILSRREKRLLLLSLSLLFLGTILQGLGLWIGP